MAVTGPQPHEVDSDAEYSLGVIGLSELEERAYRHLLRRRSADPPELARALGTGVADTATVVASLEAKGFVSRTTGPQTRLLAAPPSPAVDSVALQIEQRLQHARLAAARLSDEWTAGGDRRVDELVEIITGREAMTRRFEQLITGAQTEILGFVARPLMVADSANVDLNIQALRRGVRSRTIYERDLFETPGVDELVAACEAAGESAGVVTTLPSKMILADRTSALLPVNLELPDVEPSAAVVHAPLTASLVALFEELWRRAIPLRPTATTVTSTPSRKDLRLLALLVSGLSDAAVARQLGVSRRTVHRRLRGLMDQAGVDTRLQLVWWATSAGWVAAPPDEMPR